MISAAELPARKARITEARLALASGRMSEEDFCRQIDSLVLELAEPAGWSERGRALVALGGYGRGELAPRSDIDLLFLVSRRSLGDSAVDPVLYPLWDLAFDVGHAVRTPSECGAIAREDLTAATALLDSRLLIGDRTLLEEARRRSGIHPGGSRDMRRWIPKIIDDVAGRRARFGEISNLLEPHVKEGRGGLRDFHSARWLLRCTGRDLQSGPSSLSRGRDATGAYDFLRRVRNALHAVAGRKTDHLTFELHSEVASLVSPDAAIETFFQALHAAGHRITGVWEEAEYEARQALARRRLWGGGPAEVSRAELPQELERWCGTGEPLPPPVRKCLASMGPEASSGMLTALAGRLLRGRVPLAPLLRELHGMEMLGAVVPEVEALAHQVRYDVRHAFTTGIHCVETLSVVEDLWLGLLEREESHLTLIASALEHPHVVRLAALCHDLGKADAGGDHAKGGAAAAKAIALRLGFSTEEGDTVAALVERHHALPAIALGRDLENPISWADARRAAAPPASLEALTVLAFADLKATNPRSWSGVWSDWTRDLLLTLFSRASQGGVEGAAPKAVAEGAPPRERAQLPPDLLAQLISMRGKLGDSPSLWKVDVRARGFVEILGVAHVSPRLLSSVTGTLTHLRFDMLSIQVHGWRDGTVHLWLRAARPEGDRNGELVAERLAAAVSGEWVPSGHPRQSLPNARDDAMPVRSEVRLTQGDDPYHSVLDVRCRDRRGLMHDLAAVFEKLGLTATYVLASTVGPVARDVFHLQDIFGSRVEGEAKVKALLEGVCRVARARFCEHVPPRSRPVGRGEGLEAPCA